MRSDRRPTAAAMPKNATHAMRSVMSGHMPASRRVRARASRKTPIPMPATRAGPTPVVLTPCPPLPSATLKAGSSGEGEGEHVPPPWLVATASSATCVAAQLPWLLTRITVFGSRITAAPPLARCGDGRRAADPEVRIGRGALLQREAAPPVVFPGGHGRRLEDASW